MNKLLLIIIFSSLLLSSCAGLKSFLPKPYRTDIHQGSVVNLNNIEQLEINMSKQQVLDIMGSPSVVDLFHNNHWEYINHTRLGSGEVVYYYVQLIFADSKLIAINIKDVDSLTQQKQ